MRHRYNDNLTTDQATLHEWLRLHLFLGEEPALSKDTWIDWYPGKPQAIKMCAAYAALFVAHGWGERFGVRPPRRAPGGGWDIIIGPARSRPAVKRAVRSTTPARLPRRRAA